MIKNIYTQITSGSSIMSELMAKIDPALQAKAWTSRNAVDRARQTVIEQLYWELDPPEHKTRWIQDL